MPLTSPSAVTSRLVRLMSIALALEVRSVRMWPASRKLCLKGKVVLHHPYLAPVLGRSTSTGIRVVANKPGMYCIKGRWTIARHNIPDSLQPLLSKYKSSSSHTMSSELPLGVIIRRINDALYALLPMQVCSFHIQCYKYSTANVRRLFQGGL